VERGGQDFPRAADLEQLVRLIPLADLRSVLAKQMPGKGYQRALPAYRCGRQVADGETRVTLLAPSRPDAIEELCDGASSAKDSDAPICPHAERRFAVVRAECQPGGEIEVARVTIEERLGLADKTGQGGIHVHSGSQFCDA